MPHLTTNEAAAELGVSPNRVRQLIRAGRLPARRVARDWRIDPKHLPSVSVRVRTGRPRKA